MQMSTKHKPSGELISQIFVNVSSVWLRELLRCRGVLIRWSLSFLWKNGEKVERWVEVAVCFLGYGWRSIFSFRSRPAFSAREEERRGVLSWVSTVRCSGPGGSRLRRVSLVGFLNLSVLLLAWCVLVGFFTTAASS
ncbi:unnamed protein product [Brassica napus]|uniref:(rape) hypothetical protein n=1 Tax=Brassica napus TaxID=3708 RepID=A0A816M1J3_BRANA|nr:unnamed protein product [Brassica napus]